MQHSPRSLVVVAVLAIAIGIVVRVADLDRGVYGFDETVTALRVAGATLPQLDRALASGSLPSLDALRDRYQRARADTGLSTTVTALAIDDPQHPPLYYLCARLWRAFGDGVPARRTLALVFGLGFIAATWWFARTAFDRTTAWIMTGLVSVSPFHVAFAAYDREYGLWALFTALASAALVRALALGGTYRWIAYGACATAGLYTDTFFLDVLVAHAAYVAISYRRAPRDRFARFALAVTLPLVAFAPWIATIATHWNVVAKTTGWNAAPLPARLLFEKWGFETTAVFFDGEYAHANLLGVALLVLVVVAGAAAAAFGRGDRSGVALASALFVVPVLVLVVPDLALHESRSTATRYLTPAWFGLEALVAAGLANALGSTTRARIVATVAAALLVVAGASSEILALRGGVPWLDPHDAPLVAVARELDRNPNASLCAIDSDETALILSDAVRAPIRLSRTCTFGAFVVATSDEIDRAASRDGGSFRRVALAATGETANALVARAHAASGRAHAVTTEDRALWRFEPR